MNTEIKKAKNKVRVKPIQKPKREENLGINMNDSLREYFSYFGLYWKMFTAKKHTKAIYKSFGPDKDQYFLYFKPEHVKSDKVIIWVHGGGWNAGNPKIFDYVGQAISKEGYHIISIGYRLSPKNKYPTQIEDVAEGFNAAIRFLNKKNIDTSKVVVIGPSAGAHLTSILCFSKKVQEKYAVDISPVIGYVGFGGPYSFGKDKGTILNLLLGQLLKKGYNPRNAEPVSLISESDIPMLLIQSKHDGVVDYSCGEDFKRKADELGIKCELYSVTDKKNTHSWYTAGLFFESRKDNKGLDKFYSWIEAL